MNKNGFTLVEVIACVAILSLIIIIVVPSINNSDKHSKKKLLETKIELAKKQAVLYGEYNRECFKVNNAAECLIKNCTENEGIVNCTITLQALAEKEYISFDDDNKILNPVTNEDISNETIYVSYNKENNTVHATGTTISLD